MSARYGPQYYPSPKILLYMEKADNRLKSFTFVNFYGCAILMPEVK